MRDKNAPVRKIFVFYTTQELLEKLNQSETLRQRLKSLPQL
jgi:hypothetical protein